MAQNLTGNSTYLSRNIHHEAVDHPGDGYFCLKKHNYFIPLIPTVKDAWQLIENLPAVPVPLSITLGPPYSLVVKDPLVIELNSLDRNFYLFESIASQAGTWSQTNVMKFANQYKHGNMDLVYACLNDVTPTKSQLEYKTLLSHMDCDGPHNYGPTNFTPYWNNGNNFEHPASDSASLETYSWGDYNANDWMWLYNMYRLKFGSSSFPSYDDVDCKCTLNDVIVANTNPINNELVKSINIKRVFKNYLNFGISLKEFINSPLKIYNNKILTNETELVICKTTVKIKSGGVFKNKSTTNIGDSIKTTVFSDSYVRVENNGLLDIQTNTKMIVKSFASLTADGANAKIVVRNGGKLILESFGSLELINNGSLIIESGGKLIVDPSAAVNINNNGKLIIEDNGYALIKTKPVSGTSTLWENGKLIFNQGAQIQLKGDNAVLEINGQLHIGDNAVFKFTYPGSNSGYIKFNRGAGVWWDNSVPDNAHITCGNNAKFQLFGQSKTDKMIEINQLNVIMPKNLNQFILNKCQIEFNVPDAMIETDAVTSIGYCTFKGTTASFLAGGIKNTRGLLVFGQDVCIISNNDFIDLGTGINGALFYGGYKQKVKNCNFINNNVGINTIGAGVEFLNNTFTNNEIAIVNTDITTNCFIKNNTITAIDTNISTSGPLIGVYTMGSNVIYEAQKNNINNTGYAFITDYNELKLRCNNLTYNSVATYIRNNAKLNMTTLLGAGFNNASNCNQFAKFEDAGYWDSQLGYNAFKINDNTPCYNTTLGSVTTRHCPTISEGTILNFNNYNTTTGLYEQPAEFNYWFNSSTLLEKTHNKVSKSPEHSGFSVPIYENVVGLNPLTNLASTDCPTPPGGGGGGGGSATSLRVHPLDNGSGSSNITTASLYNKQLQWALKQSLSKLDDLEDLPKINKGVDLLTEILKANYPIPVTNEVDDYLLELSYQKLFSGVAQLVELHKLAGGKLNPMPRDLQLRFDDLHSIIALRIARKNPAEANYKVYTDLVKFDKALIYRLAEQRNDAILKTDAILADNPKPEHIPMLQHWRCIFETEERALNKNITVYQALNDLLACRQSFQNITNTPISGARLINTIHNNDGVYYANDYAVAVYLNPTSGSLFIGYDLKESKTIRVEIADMQGKTLKQYELNNQETQFKIENLELENGVYMYQMIVDGKCIMNNKIVVLK